MSLPILLFFIDTSSTDISTLSLHDALPIYFHHLAHFRIIKGNFKDDINCFGFYIGSFQCQFSRGFVCGNQSSYKTSAKLALEAKSEEHTSELQSRGHLVCCLLLEKTKYILI